VPYEPQVVVTFFFLSKKKVTKEKSRGLVPPFVSWCFISSCATRALRYAAFLLIVSFVWLNIEA